MSENETSHSQEPEEITIKPEGSPWTLAFRLLGIPVKVFPGFWLMVVLLGSSGGPSVERLALWVGAVFVSILIHELGHGYAAKIHGAKPSIELHMMGGLTYHTQIKGWWKDVSVIIAGPLAGFAFIILVFLGLNSSGTQVEITDGFPFISWDQFSNPLIDLFLYYLCFVNIGWGLLNLMPVLPLDGGQLARRVIQIRSTRAWTELLASSISILTAGALSAFCYYILGSVYGAVLFGYFAFINLSGFNHARRQMASPHA